jgi:magnesium-dependent phosphatase-1
MPAVNIPENHPKLVALDLDWTVWQGDCDKDFIPPFIRDIEGFARDRYGRYSEAYRDVKEIVGALIDAGIPVAYVSRNPSYTWVKQLLQTIKVRSKKHPEATLYDAMPDSRYLLAFSTPPGYRAKDKHFADLYNISGISLTDMLFFDDASDNIHAARFLGITSVLVKKLDGVTKKAFFSGIEAWQTARIPAIQPVQQTQQAQQTQQTQQTQQAQPTQQTQLVQVN